MKYTAHIRNYDKAEQSVEAHCSETAGLASEYAELAGLKKTAELSGLLHDMGKFTNDFNDYIHGDTRFRLNSSGRRISVLPTEELCTPKPMTAVFVKNVEML